METEPGEKKHLFTNKQLWALLVPVVLEQLLNSIMGTADTMMVSNVGSAAISAVSLVDSFNVLVIQVFAALAAGGTMICSQYMGQKNTKNATDAAKQLAEGKIDAFFCTAGLQTTVISELTKECSIRILSIDDKCIKKLLTAYLQEFH